MWQIKLTYVSFWAHVAIACQWEVGRRSMTAYVDWRRLSQQGLLTHANVFKRVVVILTTTTTRQLQIPTTGCKCTVWSKTRRPNSDVIWHESWLECFYTVGWASGRAIATRLRRCFLMAHGWSLINRFRTGQGPCRANLHKWGLAQSPSCDCGQRQTTNHIVDTCPLTNFEGGLSLLHEADYDAVIRLESTATAALAK